MDKLTQEAAFYVQRLFDKYMNPALIYHNLAHTTKVVGHVEEMIRYYGLSDADSRIVRIAAWFHDVGHLFAKAKDHENESVAVMKMFLQPGRTDDKTIELITACIMATRLPANPASLLEQILCDADTYHLGTAEFLQSDEAVKQELQLREGILSERWDLDTLALLEQHRFFTAYCYERLTEGKQLNIERLRNRIHRNNC